MNYNYNLATQCCENHISGETFGHQRLWGSVGWGSSALLVGYLVDLASADQLLFDYSPAFGVLTFLWILDIFIIMKLPVSTYLVNRYDVTLKIYFSFCSFRSPQMLSKLQQIHLKILQKSFMTKKS